jgi:hypothetical protein
MDLYTAIEYICSIDAEAEAIDMLMKTYRKKVEKNYNLLCNREKCMNAIRKINKERYKDEAIDALSNVSCED